ncbi:MAG: GntR family transcriptional regulator [Planctomycetota bacterium]|nr:GntR family transcriptional regulator [Planctomycetota bacterium]
MPRRATKTGSLVANLKRRILSGEWKAGQAIPSERELAREFGVSRVTARRCLKELCREELLIARPTRGYFPVAGDVSPAELKHRKAVLFYYMDDNGAPMVNNINAGIINGANAEALRTGLEFYSISCKSGSFLRFLRDRWEKTLRGLLLNWVDQGMLEYLLKSNLPFVVVENDIEGLPVTSVIQDNAGGTLQALEHMYAKGHRRIAIIANDLDWIHPRQRLAAYREFILRKGLSDCSDLCARVPGGEEGGARGAVALLDGPVRPTGIFVAGARLLPGVLKELAKRNLRCPEDVSLVVWGDPKIGIGPGEGPGITHIVWSAEEMGGLAMRALEERVRSGRPERMVIRIGTRLVDCGSVATVEEAATVEET